MTHYLTFINSSGKAVDCKFTDSDIKYNKSKNTWKVMLNHDGIDYEFFGVGIDDDMFEKCLITEYDADMMVEETIHLYTITHSK